MKAVIVGTGYWGTKLFNAFSDKLDIVGYVNSGRTEFEEIERIEWQDALNDKSIDVAIIACPIEFLGKYAIDALNAGKHVWLEKPGANNLKQLIEINKIAKQSNLKCCVNYSLVQDKNIQNRDIDYLNLYWNKYGSFDNDIRLNLACHFVAVFVYLFGSDINLHSTFFTSEHAFAVASKFGSFKINRTVKEISERAMKMKINRGSWIRFQSNNKCLLNKQINNFINAINGKQELFTDDYFALQVYKKLEEL